MRDYGKVYTAFWGDPKIRSLSDDGRMLALYLLTCQHSNMLGLFFIPDVYAAHDMKWTPQRVSKGFAELSRNGFATRDEGSEYLFISNFPKWNPFENGNVAKGAEKIFEMIPACEAKRLCAKALLKYGKHISVDFRNRLETVSEQSRNPEPEPEPNQSLTRAEPEPEPEPTPEPRKARRARTPEGPLPEGFEISERVRQWAEEQGHANLQAHFDAFVLKARAKGYRYADWDAALMNAIRGNWAGVGNGQRVVPLRGESTYEHNVRVAEEWLRNGNG